MKNTIKDFDLDLKTTKNNSDEPLVGSRYLSLIITKTNQEKQ